MGKKTKIAALVLATVLAAALLLIWRWAIFPQRAVGLQISRADGFPVAIWYPTTATPRPTTLVGNALLSVVQDGAVDGKALPLVVLSHGNGGGIGSHVDLALALASAGYVVATPMHKGDNLQDASALAKPDFFVERAGQVQATIRHVLEQWSGRAAVDGARVGVFGFSAGGTSALLAAGAKPDFSKVAKRCAEAPEAEFVCQVLKQAGNPLLQGAASNAQVERAGRVRALVLAAPGLGFTMDDAALEEVQMPVQLWSGRDDTTVPYASNIKPVRDGLGARVEYHEVPGARHLSFLAPCRLFGPPAICADGEGFDRGAFHARMNRDVVAFFDQQLKAR